jgi:zinc transport system substrate-binding protein
LPSARWVGLVVASAVLAGCSSGRAKPPGPAAHRLKVVASLFPLAEVARRVGGALVDVVDLTPTGVEPQGLEVSAGQLMTIHGADVMLEIGGGFQPAVEAAAAVGSNTVAVLPAVNGGDPHVWLDPVVLQQVVRLVAVTFDRADPAGRGNYDRGARDFSAALGALDISYRTSLSDCPRHDVVTSGAAFGRMADRYGFTAHPLSGSTPADLAGLIRAKGVTTILTEPLSSTQAADALARQTHVKTAVLDPIQGLTAPEQARGATYLSLMTDNREALRHALGCLTSEG